MGSGNHWDNDGQYIEKSIGYRARALVRDWNLPPDDIEDIKQEMRLDLLRRLPSFNPEKAGRRTFISRLLRNKAASLVESFTAGKRDFRKEAWSLNREIVGAGGGSFSPIDFLSSDDYQRGAYDRFLPNETLLELRIDFRMILPHLTASQRQICLLFSDGHNPTTAAGALGISRSTLYDRMKALRNRFADFGYVKISESPDTFERAPVCK
jgi:RNA polymerase sigma-70 factor (ECF subfamily)